MVELKDCQQWEMEGKLQFHSHLMLIAQFWFLAGFNSAWAQSHSRVRFLGTPWYATHQAPLSMGFSRQEYWSRFPCPPPGDLLNPVIKPRFPSLQVHYSLSEPRRKPSILSTLSKKKKNPVESGQWLFPSHYGSHCSIGLHSKQLLHSPLPGCTPVLCLRSQQCLLR